MTTPNRRTLAILVLALAATAANFLYHQRRSAAATAFQISTFEVGAPLPALDLRLLTGAVSGPAGAPLPTGCRILVLYSPGCPHCHTAALLETGVPDSVRLPVVWISDQDNTEALAFAAQLNPAVAARFGGTEAFRALRARGVPAMFLVSPDDRVLEVAGYSGSENDHRVLRARCPA